MGFESRSVRHDFRHMPKTVSQGYWRGSMPNPALKIENIEKRMAGGGWIHMINGIPRRFAENVSKKTWDEKWSAGTVCFQKALDNKGDEFALISWWQEKTCWIVEYWFRTSPNSDQWGLKILYHLGGSGWLMKKHGMPCSGGLHSPFGGAEKAASTRYPAPKFQMPIFETTEQSVCEGPAACTWLSAFDAFGNPKFGRPWKTAKTYHRKVYITTRHRWTMRGRAHNTEKLYDFYNRQ